MKIDISKDELYMLLDAISDEALELGQRILKHSEFEKGIKYADLVKRNQELHKIYINWTEEKSE